MFDLIVSGLDRRQRIRFSLPADRTVTVGRDNDADVPVAWESMLSRKHVELTVADDQVCGRKCDEAVNPVFVSGVVVREFLLQDGEAFVVGATEFRLAASQADDSSQQDRLLEEIRFESGQLRHIPFSDADKRIEVLTHLPSVIWGARTDEDFFLRVAQLLLAGIPRAEAVAIVEPDGEKVQILHWDRRTETEGGVHPSSRLVREAVVSSNRSVLHVWEPEFENTDPQYTATGGFSWAFCTPVLVTGQPRRGLYVAGHLDSASVASGVAGHTALLSADVRFTELVSEIVSSLRRLSRLERHQAGLRQFFAPPILEALGQDLDTDILEPRECDVTVLFCDLRGFSHHAENAAHDLTGLLSRVSEALGVMTEQILYFGGVTGDFQGDAALGFWGWPFASESAPLNACRAALAIRKAFVTAAATPGHTLADFEMGIGIAHGRAVAGKIGTTEQVKVTVFGPVVNLASRLETMTSQLRVPIVLDEATAQLVREKLGHSEARTRRLGRVIPVGMETPVFVSELLPPEHEFPLLTDEHIAQYEHGVNCFINGDWESAWQSLHRMPAGDRAQDFLAMPIVQHNRRAPADWDGIIRLTSK
ncbi:MAG: adenylate/guanylate cyclase domain-containing protein [Planctomycetota bacterium]|nr:adenylate/guanylate cyclase domain-containing protein [Planctomycetota bacterium]MDA1164442.1 adenylate/guanylate cyclase domain-containing protein [Planctomycetota bacterium]